MDAYGFGDPRSHIGVGERERQHRRRIIKSPRQPLGSGRELTREVEAVYSVLLVASFRLAREGMRALIDREENFQVIGETDDRGQTMRLLGTHRPDVILFDLDPDEDACIETISEIVRNHPGIRIIAL